MTKKSKFIYSIIFVSSFNLFADDTADCSNIDNLFEPTINELAPPPKPATPDTCIDAAGILSLITPPNGLINVPAILQEDIYLKTVGPVTIRSLLDQPSLQHPIVYDNCFWTLTAQAFYNYSPRVFFTKNSPFISSYIDLNNQNIINEISNADLTDANIPGILGLFRNLKLHQHRLGLMLGMFKQFDRIHITARLPVYYMLEHFFLTEDERNRIENNPFFESPNGISGQDDVEQFALRHLVSDRWGLGDTRVSVLYNLYDRPCSQIWTGLQATIPTAVSFQRGLLAAEFDPNCPVPPFNLQKLFNLYICYSGAQKREADLLIQDQVKNFLIGALDRLSTILINTPLGNGRHFGVGPQLNIRYILNGYWSMHSYLAVEFFSTHKEKRFFLIKKDPADFNRDYTNTAQAEQNLLFLNAQIINTIYPSPVEINVKPGFITKFNHVFMFDSANWHGSLGFDYWRQEREKFDRIVKTDIPYDKLNLKKGVRPSAQQWSLFGDFGYYGSAYCERIAWHALLTGEATISNEGIGKSFIVGVRAGLDF